MFAVGEFDRVEDDFTKRPLEIDLAGQDARIVRQLGLEVRFHCRVKVTNICYTFLCNLVARHFVVPCIFFLVGSSFGRTVVKHGHTAAETGGIEFHGFSNATHIFPRDKVVQHHMGQAIDDVQRRLYLTQYVSEEHVFLLHRFLCQLGRLLQFLVLFIELFGHSTDAFIAGDYRLLHQGEGILQFRDDILTVGALYHLVVLAVGNLLRGLHKLIEGAHVVPDDNECQPYDEEQPDNDQPNDEIEQMIEVYQHLIVMTYQSETPRGSGHRRIADMIFHAVLDDMHDALFPGYHLLS